MFKIRTLPEKCAACGICELACSYHHNKVFSRRLSSIEIYKSEAEGRVEMSIHDTESSIRKACNRCSNEAVPLCVRWCPVGALAVGGK